MFWRKASPPVSTRPQRGDRRLRNGTVAIVPLLLGILIEAVIEILTIRYALGRQGEDIAHWFSLGGLAIAMILFFGDFDRFAVRRFRSEAQYQNILGNITLLLVALLFIAITVRWYARHGDRFTL